ncbi:MAG: Small subunit (SSU) processome component, partial [Chaenotheca gracillima]
LRSIGDPAIDFMCTQILAHVPEIREICDNVNIMVKQMLDGTLPNDLTLDHEQEKLEETTTQQLILMGLQRVLQGINQRESS